eukprot:10921259-Lingulodinium_polyedra.AAC.1
MWKHATKLEGPKPAVASGQVRNPVGSADENTQALARTTLIRTALRNAVEGRPRVGLQRDSGRPST